MFSRAALACVLTLMFVLQTLPCVCVREPLPDLDGTGGFTCRFEPLQVCDDGDVPLGGLGARPLLVPGAPLLFPPRDFLCLVPEGAAPTRDGFRQPIDHPPEFPAFS